MKNDEYAMAKRKLSYELEKQHKLFKKARAIILDDEFLYVLKINYFDGNRVVYNFPGGGVDEGETSDSAAVREAYEEYGAVVKPIKYLTKQYYTQKQNYDGNEFTSHRVQYFYVCKLLKLEERQMGLDNEFNFDDRTVEKTKIKISEFLKMDKLKFPQLSNKAYEMLVEFIKTQN